MKNQVISIALLVSVAGTMGAMQPRSYNYNGGTKPVSVTFANGVTQPVSAVQARAAKPAAPIAKAPAVKAPVAKPAPVAAPTPKAPAVQAVPKAAVTQVAAKRCVGGACPRVVQGQMTFKCVGGRCGLKRPAAKK